MAKRRILPTSAAKPIAPEFLPKFAAHGWRRVENIWGRSTVLAWRRAIGAERMDAARREQLALTKAATEANRARRAQENRNVR